MKLHQTKISNLMGRIALYKDWWKVTPPFNRLYNMRPTHTVTLRTGERMQVRDIFGYDLPIVYEIFKQDTYHLRKISLPSQATIYDIGAHIGSFSVAAHSYFPDAHIVAFEPHPENFNFLQKNAPFAVCVNRAVVGIARSVHLGDHIASSSYALSDTGVGVEAVTLDAYIQAVSRIDLLKMDVEGSEKDIFEHLSPDLLGKINRIIMEIHPPHTTEWFAKLFIESGFSVTLEDNILFAVRNKQYP